MIMAENTSSKQKPSLLSRIFFPVNTLLGAKYLASTGSFIKNSVGRLITPTKLQRQESFAEAVERMDLTDDDLELRKISFLRQSVFFLIFGVFLILLAFYRLYLAEIGSGILIFLLSFALLAYAFRAHFWYFQIKHRKLGCTMQEWWVGHINTTHEQEKTDIQENQ